MGMLLQTLFRRSTSLLSLSGFVTGQAKMSTQVPSSLWKLGRLNHVAIATPDLLKSVSLYRDIMGAAVSDPEDLPEHGVTVVFVTLENTKIELLHPLGEKSPIAGLFSIESEASTSRVIVLPV